MSRFSKLGVHQFSTSYRNRFLQLLHLPAVVATIVALVGGSDLTNDSVSTQITGKKLIKAGLVIFLLIYICLFPLVAKSASELKALPSDEKRILLALIVAMPLLAVRILFALLAYFSTISAFSPFDGNMVVRVFMGILEELVIVIAYTLAGLLVPKYGVARVDDTEMDLQHREIKRRNLGQNVTQ